MHTYILYVHLLFKNHIYVIHFIHTHIHTILTNLFKINIYVNTYIHTYIFFCAALFELSAADAGEAAAHCVPHDVGEGLQHGRPRGVGGLCGAD